MEMLLEKFKINNKCQLNSEDISSLTLLYLPLIGIDSFALYCALTSLETNKEYYIKKLINITNIPTLNALTNTFDKLEGIGLLNTFYDSNKGYLFIVNPPLKNTEFMKEEVLVTLLETQIGNLEINELKEKVKTNIKGYKNITKKLNEVYTVSTKTSSTVLKNLVNPNLNVENNNFNYTLFKMLFDSSFIDEDVLNDEQFKSMIIKISFIYKLSEEEMKDVVFNSINNDKRCDYPSLSKYARIAFQKKYKVETPKLVTVKEDQYVQSIEDDVTLKLCNDLETMSPSEVLESLSGMKPTPSELKIFEDLLNNCNLTIGAINFMIMYVSTEKNGELPGYNYFEKIASTWTRAKVKTAIDAIRYVEKKNAERAQNKEKTNKTSSVSKKKKEAVLPDWYTEYEKGLQEQTNETKLTDQELKEIANKLFEE